MGQKCDGKLYRMFGDGKKWNNIRGQSLLYVKFIYKWRRGMDLGVFWGSGWLGSGAGWHTFFGRFRKVSRSQYHYILWIGILYMQSQPLQRNSIQKSKHISKSDQCLITLLKKRAPGPTSEAGVTKMGKDWNWVPMGLSKKGEGNDEVAGDWRPVDVEARERDKGVTSTSIEGKKMKTNESCDSKQSSGNISFLKPRHQILAKESISKRFGPESRNNANQPFKAHKTKQYSIYNMSSKFKEQKGFKFTIHNSPTQSNQPPPKTRSQSTLTKHPNPQKANSQSLHSQQPKPSTSQTKVRKIKEMKEEILIRKWLAIGLGSQSESKENRRKTVERGLGVQGLRVGELVQGVWVRQILESRGDWEQADQIGRVLEFIQSVLSKESQTNTRIYPGNISVKVTHKPSKIPDQPAPLFSIHRAQPQKQSKHIYTHNTIRTENPPTTLAPALTQPQPPSSPHPQRTQQIKSFNLSRPEMILSNKEEYKYYLHCRPHGKNVGLAGEGSFSVKEDLGHGEGAWAGEEKGLRKERLHSTRGSLFKKRFNKKDSIDRKTEHSPSALETSNQNQTIGNEPQGSYALTEVQKQVQLPVKGQEKRQLSSGSSECQKVSQFKRESMNGRAISIEDDKSKRKKHSERNKLFSLYRSLLEAGAIKQSKASSSKKGKQNESPAKPRPQQNFLRKRHGRYAQIIDKINLARLNRSAKQSPETRTIAEESSQNGETFRQRLGQGQAEREELVPEVKIAEKEREEVSLRTETEGSEDRKQVCEEDLERLIRANSRLMGRHEEQEEEAGQEPIAKNRKNRLKVVRSGVKSTRKSSFLKATNFSGNFSKEGSLMSIQMETSHQNSKRLSKKHSFAQKKRSSQFQLQQSNPQPIPSKPPKKPNKLLTRESPEHSQFRAHQQDILNELYRKTLAQTQKKINPLSCNNQELSQEELKAEGQAKVERERKLRARVQEFRLEFQRMLEYKIDVQGPSVFCKVMADRSNKLGYGFDELESIYMLKKPKYLNVSYSSKAKNQNYYSFFQEGFEIDFIKKFTAAGGLLGQKAIDSHYQP